MEGHTWQTFMVVLSSEVDRKALIAKLKSEGIEANLGAQALSELSYYKQKYDFGINDLLISKNLFYHGLALPLSPLINEDEIRFICEIIIDLLKDD